MPATKRLIGPAVEPRGTPSPIITEPPIDIITAGQYNDVPCMFGYNADEGISIDFHPHLKHDFENEWNFENIVPYHMNIEQGSELAKHLGENIKRKYFANGEDKEENLHAVSIV